MSIQRRMLSKKEKKQLVGHLPVGEAIADTLKRSRIEVARIKEGDIHVYIIEGLPFLVSIGTMVDNTLHKFYLPYLGLFYNKQPLALKLRNIFFEAYSKVVVDKGAVKHILNGADVMAPGIVSVDVNRVEKLGVCIVTSEDNYVLSTGYFITTREEIKECLARRRGRVVKNLHYVGDKIWKIVEQLSQ